MPVFALGEDPVFPPPELADPDGLLAVGGDLSPERIIQAYTRGIFPWYSEDSPILWWSPDPRLVLFPGELKLSRSLRQVIRRDDFRVTFDTAFKDVITGCASVKRGHEDGTWITEDMMHAYCLLHEQGYAHSVESWYGDELAGGLYGISLGRIFFGESMFATRPNSSKVAFAALVERLTAAGYALIDCQVKTRHLQSFGAREISGDEFRKILRRVVGLLPVDAPWDAKTALMG
ncbi:MAG: leucyl/phenylalanyl-tRNA--protein transferase [Thermodesulfovibrio sp.]|nr:leucyl/phenylalanyl-tRNA--protein transferase [Thermodesulfovibrio sp.]